VSISIGVYLSRRLLCVAALRSLEREKGQGVAGLRDWITKRRIERTEVEDINFEEKEITPKRSVRCEDRGFEEEDSARCGFARGTAAVEG